MSFVFSLWIINEFEKDIERSYIKKYLQEKHLPALEYNVFCVDRCDFFTFDQN